MLKSELNQLEKRVNEVLENYKPEGESDHVQWLSDRVKSIQTHCADLKEKWVHELFSSAKEQVIIRYVHYHQAGITQLSNEVSRVVKINEQDILQPDSRNQLFELILNELEQLLIFLKHQCYQYFDLDYKITIHSCHRRCAQTGEFCRELMNYPQKEVDPELLESVSISVQEMTAEALRSGISYRQAEHVLNLLRMIKQLMQATEGTTTDSLALALYRQNLNTHHFINWYQERLLLQIGELTGRQERDHLISRQIKLFSGVFVDPEKALEPELPPTDQLLLPWLYEKKGIRKKRSG